MNGLAKLKKYIQWNDGSNDYICIHYSGKKEDEITITSDPNKTGKDRSMPIKLIAPNKEILKTITINQPCE